MSEGLSQHVLRNYAQFVAGIAEVSALEADLVKAHVCATVRASLYNEESCKIIQESAYRCAWLAHSPCSNHAYAALALRIARS
jgi:hypothetical protein